MRFLLDNAKIEFLILISNKKKAIFYWFYKYNKQNHTIIIFVL